MNADATVMLGYRFRHDRSPWKDNAQFKRAVSGVLGRKFKPISISNPYTELIDNLPDGREEDPDKEYGINDYGMKLNVFRRRA